MHPVALQVPQYRLALQANVLYHRCSHHFCNREPSAQAIHHVPHLLPMKTGLHRHRTMPAVFQGETHYPHGHISRPPAPPATVACASYQATPVRARYRQQCHQATKLRHLPAQVPCALLPHALHQAHPHHQTLQCQQSQPHQSLVAQYSSTLCRLLYRPHRRQWTHTALQGSSPAKTCPHFCVRRLLYDNGWNVRLWSYQC